jgi:hypothetical protein
MWWEDDHEWWRDSKGNGCGVFESNHPIVHVERLRKTIKVKVGTKPVMIQTGCLTNSSLQYHFWTNLFGEIRGYTHYYYYSNHKVVQFCSMNMTTKSWCKIWRVSGKESSFSSSQMIIKVRILLWNSKCNCFQSPSQWRISYLFLSAERRLTE